jgi:uncharacterized membrane protein
MLWTLVLVILLISVLGGGVGYSRFGYRGFSPAGIVLLVLAVLYFTGNLRLR